MAEILPEQDVQPEVLHDDRTGAPRSESYASYTQRYADALGISPKQLRGNVSLYDVRPSKSGQSGDEPQTDSQEISAAGEQETAPQFPYKAVWADPNLGSGVLNVVGRMEAVDGKAYLRIDGLDTVVPADEVIPLGASDISDDSISREAVTKRKIREISDDDSAKQQPSAEAPQTAPQKRETTYPYNAMSDHSGKSEEVKVTGSYGLSPDNKEYIKIEGQPGGVDSSHVESFGPDIWDSYRAKRALAARWRGTSTHAIPYPDDYPRILGRRGPDDPRGPISGTDGSRHNVYPGATNKFEATPDAEQVEFPYGAILTVPDGANPGQTKEVGVTVIGHVGPIGGVDHVRIKPLNENSDKDYEIVPTEMVVRNERGEPIKNEDGSYRTVPLLESLESRYGIDTSRFVLAGIGPALYWKKIDTMANQSGDAPGIFKSMFSKFARSHPKLQLVGSRVGGAVSAFRENHPRLGEIVNPASNDSMYSFKEISERDMQSARTFYMARPNHPITIWFKSRNYDGTLNAERKQELYDMRVIGRRLQSEIGPLGAWRSLFNPNSFYRRDLEKFLASTPGSLGFRAVEFAGDLQIRNRLHRDLTHTQWAISLMNSRRLTSRELFDFMRFMQDQREYARRGTSAYPRTAVAPKVSPHLATA